MRAPVKDLAYVTMQFLLFMLYLIPAFATSIHLPGFFKYIALSATILGLLIIIVSILQLNRNLTPFPSPKTNSTLIQTGLYKLVRHPIYTGIILAATGYGFYTGSVWKISTGAGLFILFYFKSKYEENMLLRKFPDYGEYKRKTGRFFPVKKIFLM